MSDFLKSKLIYSFECTFKEYDQENNECLHPLNETITEDQLNIIETIFNTIIDNNLFNIIDCNNITNSNDEEEYNNNREKIRALNIKLTNHIKNRVTNNNLCSNKKTIPIKSEEVTEQNQYNYNILSHNDVLISNSLLTEKTIEDFMGSTITICKLLKCDETELSMFYKLFKYLNFNEEMQDYNQYKRECLIYPEKDYKYYYYYSLNDKNDDHEIEENDRKRYFFTPIICIKLDFKKTKNNIFSIIKNSLTININWRIPVLKEIVLKSYNRTEIIKSSINILFKSFSYSEIENILKEINNCKYNDMLDYKNIAIENEFYLYFLQLPLLKYHNTKSAK